VSLRELHALVRALVPGAGRAIWSGRARTAGLVDTRRIEEDLGWTPSISLHKGLAELLNGNHRSEHDKNFQEEPKWICKS
jgi:nucleoside-diphosphate-sugar epimerase